MFVPVNAVRLFVDVLSPKLVPSGPRMIERPTVVALHGGPSDHAHMREVVAPLSDGAQVVLFDHRGCGRSERGDPSRWTMDQWGDDVRGLCDAAAGHFIHVDQPERFFGALREFVGADAGHRVV